MILRKNLSLLNFPLNLVRLLFIYWERYNNGTGDFQEPVVLMKSGYTRQEVPREFFA